jgi:hypothetical protein
MAPHPRDRKEPNGPFCPGVDLFSSFHQRNTISDLETLKGTL